MSAATMNEMERLRRERDALASQVQEAQKLVRLVQSERDALAAHVERLRSEFEELTHYASYETLLDTMDNLFNDTPTTSLARLIAKEVEASLGHIEGLMGAGVAAEDAIAETRRLVEETTHD